MTSGCTAAAGDRDLSAGAVQPDVMPGDLGDPLHAEALLPQNRGQPGVMLGDKFVPKEKFLVFFLFGDSNTDGTGFQWYNDDWRSERAWHFSGRDKKWLPAQPGTPHSIDSKLNPPWGSVGFPFVKKLTAAFPRGANVNVEGLWLCDWTHFLRQDIWGERCAYHAIARGWATPTAKPDTEKPGVPGNLRVVKAWDTGVKLALKSRDAQPDALKRQAMDDDIMDLERPWFLVEAGK